MDNNGRLAKKPLRGESLRDYENRIATSTEPSVAVDAEKVEFCGSEVVVLRVQENPVEPVAVKGQCYIRKGSVNHQMTPSEIAECHLKSTGGSMDAVFVEGAARDDLDMERVREYMRAAKAAGRREFSPDENPWTVLRKFQLVKSETEITRAAYLLFAKEREGMLYKVWKMMQGRCGKNRRYKGRPFSYYGFLEKASRPTNMRPRRRRFALPYSEL